jgi:hypothetical protein
MPNQAVVLNVPNEGQAGRCDRTVTTVPDPQQTNSFSTSWNIELELQAKEVNGRQTRWSINSVLITAH